MSQAAGRDEHDWKLEQRRKFEGLLRNWGKWKREWVLSVGNTSTLEAKIVSQEILGDGCKNGANSRFDGVKTIKNEDAEKLNSIVMTLQDRYKLEMTVLQQIYVFRWSVREIAIYMQASRGSAANTFNRAKAMVESRFVGSGPERVDPNASKLITRYIRNP